MQHHLSADLVPGDHLSRSYPAVADSVPRARDEAKEFAQSAGASATQLDAIRLAVSEAATNVVIHAYDGSAGDIRLCASVDDEDLWIEVSDEGMGLRPRIDGPGLGVGLALISQVADAFTIANRDSGGTEVQMRFGLGVRDGFGEPAGCGAV
jgi:anti-sigma regulatory factor (Ser/Thr protein kinase)